MLFGSLGGQHGEGDVKECWASPSIQGEQRRERDGPSPNNFDDAGYLTADGPLPQNGVVSGPDHGYAASKRDNGRRSPRTGFKHLQTSELACLINVGRGIRCACFRARNAWLWGRRGMVDSVTYKGMVPRGLHIARDVAYGVVLGEEASADADTGV